MKGTQYAFVIAVVLTQTCAWARTFFVHPRGHDTAPGSARAPFQTLQRGIHAARPGDTIFLMEGIYGPDSLFPGLEPNGFAAIVRTSGKPDASIIIRAAYPGSAILDCEMRCDGYIDVNKSAHIAITDLLFRRSRSAAIQVENAAHIKIQRNIFERIGDFRLARERTASLSLEGSHDVLVEQNTFHDIGVNSADESGGPAPPALPARYDALHICGSDVNVLNNIFYNVPNGWLIAACDGLTKAKVTNNTFAFTSGFGGQILLQGNEQDLTFSNNIFFRPGGVAIVRYKSRVENCSVENNAVYGTLEIMDDATGCAILHTRFDFDPIFVNATTPPYDFRLRPGSPAQNTDVSVGAFIDSAPDVFSPPQIGTFSTENAK